MKTKLLLIILMIVLGLGMFLLGLWIGRLLIIQKDNSQAQSICISNCLSRAEILGLLADMAISDDVQLIPNIVAENDHAIIIQHPMPEHPIHLVALPKQRISNIAEITSEDQEVIFQTLQLIAETIQQKSLTHYQVITNGPGYQDVAYLHFHIEAELPK